MSGKVGRGPQQWGVHLCLLFFDLIVVCSLLLSLSLSLSFFLSLPASILSSYLFKMSFLIPLISLTCSTIKCQKEDKSVLFLLLLKYNIWKKKKNLLLLFLSFFPLSLTIHNRTPLYSYVFFLSLFCFTHLVAKRLFTFCAERQQLWRRKLFRPLEFWIIVASASTSLFKVYVYCWLVRSKTCKGKTRKGKKTQIKRNNEWFLRLLLDLHFQKYFIRNKIRKS